MTRRQRVAVSMQPEFRKELFDFCEARGYTVSGFIVMACKEKMVSLDLLPATGEMFQNLTALMNRALNGDEVAPNELSEVQFKFEDIIDKTQKRM